MSKWTGWVLLFLFMCFPDAVKNGITKGLDLGGRVLIPSIFPYLVISGILVKTGALHGISKKIRISNLSEHAREMLIPSLFCGYPTGAKLSALAYDNGSITKQEYSLLFLFANIPGFGFAVSYLGGIFGCTCTGVFAYLGFLLASLTLLWFFGKNLPDKPSVFFAKEKAKKLKLSDALVESVSESAQTMVSLLFFVCFFSSLIDLAQCISLPANCYPIVASFLEITTGVCLLAKNHPMEATVFFCGFSGLSVMFQSLYFDKNHAVNFPRLLLGRLVYGTVCVCYFMIFRFLFLI